MLRGSAEEGMSAVGGRQGLEISTDFLLGFSGSYPGGQRNVGCVVWGKLVPGRVNRVKKGTES